MMELAPLIKKLFCLPLLLIATLAAAQQPDREKLTEYFQNQQFEEAVDYLNPFYQRDSANLTLLGLFGYANYMNNTAEKGRLYFEKILLRDSNNVAANRYLANIQLGRNNFSAAKTCIYRLISNDPRNAAYCRILAGIYQQSLEKDSAKTYFQRAYLLAPANNKNILALAGYLISDFDYLSADSILSAALQQDSSNTDFLKMRMESAYFLKKYTGVAETGERLVALGDLSLDPLSKLVFAYYSLNRDTDCIRICRIMERTRLAVESTYYYQAKAWQRQHKLAESNDNFETCLSFSILKTSQLYYYNLAQNNETLLQYRKAIADYDTAYYLFKNPTMLYQAGRIWEEKIGDQKKAAGCYQRYLRVAHPSTPEEKKFYQFVKKKWLSMRS